MTLFEFMKNKRPHGSQSEFFFIGQYLMPLALHGDLTTDKVGNVFVTVGEGSTTLFTSHTDTCHRSGGVQKLYLDKEGMMRAKAPKTGPADCIGADDAAGMWIMIAMIHAKVPGTYAFFRGEERGGIGSSYVAKHNPDFLQRFKRAIAFDRAGYSDVITHQTGGRCASDKFAEALSDALNDQGLLYMPCDTGVYTDTAEFVDIIPECSNISVGYHRQHTPDEHLNVAYLEALTLACCKLDWEALPTERDPTLREKTWTPSWQRSLFGSDADLYPEDDDELSLVLTAWLEGDSKPLVDALAKEVYPEDIEVGRRYVDISKMSEDLIDEALFYGIEVLIDELVSIDPI